MSIEKEVLATDLRFLEALSGNDRMTLEGALDPGFILIDVMTGSEIARGDFLALLGSGRLVFAPFRHLDARVRLYDGAAIITGRTRMSGSFDGQTFDVHSRYTHVYARHPEGWRLAAAQGTPITAASG